MCADAGGITIMDFVGLSLDVALRAIPLPSQLQYRRSGLHYFNGQGLPLLEASGSLPIPPDELRNWTRDEMERKGRRREALSR